ncbi:SLC13 family permease [Clostridium sp. DSM 100503]|uniref:SLC13 family permease n=1 Tax=Clostridium sp. DSM 100503 TaxID=2963282 RepID=UPI00214A7800|nr:SLC13 family permease [Clostridium sp. DSM 100503]MCR1949881.1 SLC13 family permease [Clostridium sp. DSM 100503]
MIVVLTLSLTVYLAMIFSIKYRTAIACIGLGTILLYGTLSNTYPAHKVFESFPLEIIVLILTLGLFSKIFENNSFFKYVGDKFIDISKGRKIFITILLPFVMYFTSLFMNNLSVVLLFTFICLKLSIKFKLPTVPILVSGLIASNIGGAPLPWADTPAVVLTLYSDFTLMDFLNKLFIPCALYIMLLILYTLWWVKRDEKKSNISINQKDENPKSSNSYIIKDDDNKLKAKFMPPPPPHHHSHHHSPPPPPILHERHTNISKFRKIYAPIFLFISFIFFICIAPFFSISIAFISIIYIGLLLLVAIEKPEDILNTVSVLDSIVFIAALFMISSALEHLGILNMALTTLLSFTGTNKLLILLCILFVAFFISTFLSAGPAAATILPVCMQLNLIIGNNLVYAALALGILAGSSMLPWSATGGPIMLSETGRYLNSYKIPIEKKIEINQIYNLKKYISFSIPFSLVILFFSALYLAVF